MSEMGRNQGTGSVRRPPVGASFRGRSFDFVQASARLQSSGFIIIVRQQNSSDPCRSDNDEKLSTVWQRSLFASLTQQRTIDGVHPDRRLFPCVVVPLQRTAAIPLFKVRSRVFPAERTFDFFHDSLYPLCAHRSAYGSLCALDRTP